MACWAPQRRPSRRASVCPRWVRCSLHLPRLRRSCRKPGRRGRRDWSPLRSGPTPADPPHPPAPGLTGVRPRLGLTPTISTDTCSPPSGTSHGPQGGCPGFTGSAGPDPSCSFPFSLGSQSLLCDFPVARDLRICSSTPSSSHYPSPTSFPLCKSLEDVTKVSRECLSGTQVVGV